ncbi:MAG: 30S ribosomal protein S6 [Clostridia bacterium]|nr:30S ribosomal protein S6 [Clostridia bacterium]
MANQYQLIVILSPELGEEGINNLSESIKAKIEASAVSVDAIDSMGKKTLAYEIADQTEGFYVKYTFTSESDLPKEIERVLKITEGVLRYIVVRIGE